MILHFADRARNHRLVPCLRLVDAVQVLQARRRMRPLLGAFPQPCGLLVLLPAVAKK